MHVEIREEADLSADEFLGLANRVWPRDYDVASADAALRRTINIVARAGGVVIGTVRILTDGYFFGTVPEILVHPEWQGRGIGRALLASAWERTPTGLFFGAQPGNEAFFERCGFAPGFQSYSRRKPRGAEPGDARRSVILT